MASTETLVCRAKLAQPAAVDTCPSNSGMRHDRNDRHDSKHSLPIHLDNSPSDLNGTYFDSLITPSSVQRAEIAEVQQVKEAEVQRKRGKDGAAIDESSRNADCAEAQVRANLEDLSLDPDTRWIEGLKEARYRNLTQPMPRSSSTVQETSHAKENTRSARSLSARQKWKKAAIVARRAGEADLSESDDSSQDETTERHRKRAAGLRHAKQMDLPYFLEMVDQKHRYGSNLRAYHAVWKQENTQESFFYWLDHGEGRHAIVEDVPRERLDGEQVRYLSKEERMKYLVKVDSEGRLCWAKNGARIDTTTEYRDSIHGIVPVDDSTPMFRNGTVKDVSDIASLNETRSRSDDSISNIDEAGKYTNPNLRHASVVKKMQHLSEATIINRLMRTTLKKNTWIFVADTHFRLYVGIKQSGHFQHSSFLHGSRIAAAGLIRIKRGRLAQLSPLSGHYRPPVASFRAFVRALRAQGVDMSRVSISRAYAVLGGLEAWMHTRRRAQRVVARCRHVAGGLRRRSRAG